MAEKFATVEDYLDSLAPAVRSALEEVRATLHDAVPGAEDAISYNIATLKVGERRILHYAGWKQHISLYPMPDDEDLAEELAPYAAGKGTLRFLLAQPVPLELVARIAQRLSVARP